MNVESQTGGGGRLVVGWGGFWVVLVGVVGHPIPWRWAPRWGTMLMRSLRQWSGFTDNYHYDALDDHGL